MKDGNRGGVPRWVAILIYGAVPGLCSVLLAAKVVLDAST
jgi:hypothetical protein